MATSGLADIQSRSRGCTEMQPLLPGELQPGGELPPSSSRIPSYKISLVCMKVKESRSRDGNMDSELSVKD